VDRVAAWADAGATGSTLLYLLKQVELAVRSDLDEITRPAGLTALQHTALTVLDQHPDLTSAHGATRPTVVAWSSS
jgi:hypothetical protein